MCTKTKGVIREIPRRTYQRIKEPYERHLQPGKETVKLEEQLHP
jgi:hypothetical protein